MSTLRVPICVFAALLLLAVSGAVPAQDYPNRIIRVITAEAAGGSDFTARLIAPDLSTNLGQPLVVDNRLTLIAIETAAKAPSDGYTLLIIGSPLWLTPLVRNVSFDPLRDFSPVSLATSSPCMLVVHPALPVTSVRELIALAKARPGEINYSGAGAGASNQFAAELFKSMAGINLVAINYKGVSPALNALIAGEVQVMFPVAVSAIPHVKSGRLRALAVTSMQPYSVYPELPTIDAAGLPGYEELAMQGIFAPAGTPAAVINRLNREIVRVLNKPEVKEKFLVAGVETVGNSPEQFAAAIKAEMARLGKVIRNVGVRE